MPPQKIFRWFRKPQLRATGDKKLHHDNVPTHASWLVQSFLAKHPITQVTQLPYSPGLTPCNFWLFPELKSSFKGKRFQTINEIHDNTMGRLMVIGRNVWGPKVPTLKGTEASSSYTQHSCIMYLLQQMSLVFMLHGWIPSRQTSLYIYSPYDIVPSGQTIYMHILSTML